MRRLLMVTVIVAVALLVFGCGWGSPPPTLIRFQNSTLAPGVHLTHGIRVDDAWHNAPLLVGQTTDYYELSQDGEYYVEILGASGWYNAAGPWSFGFGIEYTIRITGTTIFDLIVHKDVDYVPPGVGAVRAPGGAVEGRSTR